jgi:DNA-binding HxlR family transcriptional regulator
MYVYAKYCPVASATTVVGDFWTPLIVRELLYGTGQFNQLARNLPGISRSVLSGRLKDLERAGIVIREDAEAGKASQYRLTESGNELRPVIEALYAWGVRWGAPSTNDENVDPIVAICMLKSRLHGALLPESRIVVEVTAHGSTSGTAWLVCERHAVSMCFDPPGFDVDLRVGASVNTLYRIWLESLPAGEAIALGLLNLEGPADLIRTFVAAFGQRT